MSRQFRGAGLLPNLLTTGTLFCGFYAILKATQDEPQAVFGYLVLAAVFDVLDGYVARALGAQSDFGGHYDSLSDAVAFGVAPAMLLLNWLQDVVHIYDSVFMTQFAIVLPLIYLLCVIIRLARFNVTMDYGKRFFTGAPSPAAALAVCALVSLGVDPLVNLRIHMPLYYSLLMSLAIIIAMLMISRLPFPSLKGLHLSKKLRPFFLVLALIIIALSVQDIRWPIFLALLYIYFVAFWRLARGLARILRDLRARSQNKPGQ